MGLEMAGVVSHVGAKVTTWRVGDPVCALLPGGGYAEKVAVPQAMLMPVPAGWSFAEANGGLPEVYLTAFVNLYMEVAVQPGEHVLVHGGASGVGTAAIQLLRATGNPIYVTVGSAEKCAACVALGATAAINYRAGDWPAQVRALTEQAGVDAIMDMVGGRTWRRTSPCSSSRGAGLHLDLSGGKAEVDLRLLMGKRLRLIGSSLFSCSVAEKVAIKEAFMARFWPDSNT